ncbi:transmembrane protein 254-like [Ylistrum balloti]|uniref:transmembrane protein 254-like n=1 Tax=Ylistrum balloti TaxID=509963 RepID=UPI002905A3A6|nr:transmembrane protein 254-like [Ylistrum balloti]
MSRKDYFRTASPFWTGLIGFGLVLLTMATFVPDKIPWYLGKVGSLGRYMGTEKPQITWYMFLGTIAIHVAEAIYAYMLCRRFGLTSSATKKWTFQTFLFGVASLSLLRKFKQQTD